MDYLVLRIDGSNAEKRKDFIGLIADQLAKKKLSPPAKSSRDYFPSTREIAKLHRDFVREVENKLTKSGSDPESKKKILSILKLAHICNTVLPNPNIPLRLLIATATDEKIAEPVVDATLDVLESFSKRHSPAFEPIFELIGYTKKESVRTDLYAVTAEALVNDLKVALGAPGRPKFKLTQYPIKGLDRLLLVIDDYEALHPIIGLFLTEFLLPVLAEAGFQASVVICCRDELGSMDVSWNQHLQPYLKEEIRLTPFDKDAAYALMEEAGVPSEQREGMFLATSGFPFLLTLAIEEIDADGDGSALFAKKFFDRTTRWMTDQQKEWFKKICYLDHIDEDTLPLLFDEELVKTVQDWFENEASIRDPDSPKFSVRPVIRNKTLRYLELRSPTLHQERTRASGATMA
jgi:hypothetical protein